MITAPAAAIVPEIVSKMINATLRLFREFKFIFFMIFTPSFILFYYYDFIKDFDKQNLDVGRLRKIRGGGEVREEIGDVIEEIYLQAKKAKKKIK